MHNAFVAVVFNILNILAQFFTRKIFLDYLGTDVLGLSMTIQNILQFLNLAELGISSAVSFTLYAHIQKNSIEAVNEIVTIQGYLYRRIAYFILVASIVTLFFFPRIFKNIELPLWYAYACFGVMLLSSMLSYFINYRQIVLSASQQEYKIVYSYQATKICMYISQGLAVYYLCNPFIWWIIIQGIFSCIGSSLLYILTQKTFPWLKTSKVPINELTRKHPNLKKKIAQVFFHKIGGFALGQTTPIILYAYTTLTEVAYYGNYILIISGIMYFANSVISSTNAGVGNLVAEADDNRIRQVFCELFSVRFIISISIAFGVLLFTPNFVYFWIGREYIMSFSTLSLMTITMFIGIFRWSIDSFINAFGLFGDIYSPLVEATLNIGLSICFGYFYGLNGVLFGALISLLIVICIWKPYYLFSRKMKGMGSKYIKMCITHYGVSLLCGIVTYMVFQLSPNNITDSVTQFIINGVLTIGFFSTSLFILIYLIYLPFRSFVQRFKKIK